MTKTLPQSHRSEEILVVGAGIAGLSACARALELGHKPLLFSSGIGASEMTSGAADLQPWASESSSSSMAPEPSVQEAWARRFLCDLGLYREGNDWVATSEGRLRPVEMVGSQVLALNAHRGQRIAVVDLPRSDWNASALARSFSTEEWARDKGISWHPLKVSGLFSKEECRYPLANFCRLLDDEERRESFERSLNSAQASLDGCSALLFGPWLGSRLVGSEAGVTGGGASSLAFGEALGPPEGPFGARFETARDSWLRTKGIVIQEQRVQALSFVPKGIELRSVDPSGRESTHCAPAVIVATGGLLGGGVGLSPRSEEGMPPSLSCSLSRPPVPANGAWEGWDPQADAGAWVRAAHYAGASADRGRIQLAGDVRPHQEGAAPSGTIVGAVLSARAAVERITKLPSP